MSLLNVVALCGALLGLASCASIFNINNGVFETLNHNDDGSTTKILPSEFPYFGVKQSRVYISMNGLVSFEAPIENFDTSIFPDRVGASAILPFFADSNGYFVGSTRSRAATTPELNSFRDTLVTNRVSLSGINLKMGYLVEWDEMSPCGCYFPRNTIQMAIVTDGCSSYAVIGYVSVRWGAAEGAKVGYVGPNNQKYQDTNIASLTTAPQVWYFEGENICTGKSTGQIVVDTVNPRTYYTCGECSIARTDTCPEGRKYDIQCGKCIVGQFPNCESAVNGGYTPWVNGLCSATCGPTGVLTRTRTCTNPPPSNGGLTCVQQNLGAASESNIPCNRQISCPVKGGYCAWVSQPCTQPCGPGRRTQTRICNCPAPAFGGADCSLLGPATQEIDCNEKQCPVDGVWNDWVSQGVCSQSCGVNGLQRYTRTCRGPFFGGKNCEGPTEENRECNRFNCPDDCTNIDAADNQIITQNNGLRYCYCLRLPDNSKSYINTCIDCPSGTVYDPLIEGCTRRNQFQCLADPFCVGKAPGDYSMWHGFANASCTNMYYTCDASLQRSTIKQCSDTDGGSHFSSTTGRCVSSNAPATCPNWRCIGRTNGNKERIDNSCRSYFTCNNYVQQTLDCPTLFYYDQVTRQCVSGGSRNNPPQGCIDPDCAGKANGVYVVNNFCDAYFTCSNQFEIAYVTCPSSQYFNPTSGTCGGYPAGNICQHKFCIQNSRGVSASLSPVGSSCFNNYVRCSGNSSPVPNILSNSVCPLNQYFSLTGSSNFVGQCTASPPASTCLNYQCIGRSDGYSFASTGYHDCRSYLRCVNQVPQLTQCAPANNQQTYFDPTTGTCTLNGLNTNNFCQHPECISRGIGNHPLTPNNQCSTSYITCDSNLKRSTNVCPSSFTANYFGRTNNGAWQCISSSVGPTGCPNAFCIGRFATNTNTNSPVYNNVNDLYCTGYYTCINGILGTGSCNNGGFLDYSAYACVATRPADQSCRVDGQWGQYGNWQYVTGSSCSASCGTGTQRQSRTRSCLGVLNGGNTCVGSATEFQDGPCQQTLPPCGDAFCINRPAGSYSKTLELVEAPNLACYKSYYTCSGAPDNKKAEITCTQADYIFDPALNGGTCRRGDADAGCPVCAGRQDGLYPISATAIHDCRNYIRCTGEVSNTLACPRDNQNRQQYFNPTNSQCFYLPHNPSICSPVEGHWSAWTYMNTGCTTNAGGACVETQTRTCSNPAPVNSATSCLGSNTQSVVCRTSCGDAFCINRLAGTYSKTLELVGAPNLACYKTYYTCSGAPGNIKTETTCTQADYIFDPALNNGAGACRRGDGDATCPNAGCIGKTNGFYQIAFSEHNCQQYYSCLNEQPTINTCANNGDRRTYFKPPVNVNDNICVLIPPNRNYCNFIQGFWGAWIQDQSCSIINGQCGRVRRRSCNNPIPKNDPNGCGNNGQDQSEILICAASECSQPCDSVTCPSGSTCSNVANGNRPYTCTCNTGFISASGDNTLNCVDIDECASGQRCQNTQRCENNRGGFTCLAAVCAVSPNICTGQNTQCVSINSGLGYQCQCQSGYQVSTGSGTSQLSCTDINECQNVNFCGQFQVCQNTIGGFNCQPEQCTANRCSGNQLCSNTNTGTGFTCGCPVGQVLDANNFNCVLPCARFPCPSNANCANVGTSRTCSCATGYTATTPGSIINNLADCRDINECTELSANGSPLHNCATGQTCVNLSPPQRFSCTTQQCTATSCSGNQVCSNTNTGFTCGCPVGQVLDANNFNCVLPCARFPCPSNANCANVGTSRTCSCATGYTATTPGSIINNLADCRDINECTELSANGSPLHNCATGQTCVNLSPPQRFSCTTQQCTATSCSGNQVCSNTNTGFTCGCPVGRVLDANNFNCVLPCARFPCPSNANCANVGTSRTCSCATGYTATTPGSIINNFADCRDINECTELSANGSPLHNCATGQTCVNLSPPQRFRCDAPSNVCSGKASGIRFPHSTDQKQYIECDGNGNQVTGTCPNNQISLGLNADFTAVVVPNGVWFSPVFLTCLNTTTNLAPATVPKLANGNWDLKQACTDIANTPTPSGELVSTRLPLDIGVTPCIQWLNCKSGVLQNSEEIIPSAGDCSTNQQGFVRDRRTCAPNESFSCPVVVA